MWQRFTEAAQRAVFYAQIEAQNDHVTQVTPEHLLIGLLREPESRGYRIAAGCGANPDTVVAALRKPAAPRNSWATTGIASGNDMTLSARAKKAIELSYHEARTMNSNNIDTAHLLLGFLREGSEVTQVLQTKGMTPETARDLAREITGDAPGEPV